MVPSSLHPNRTCHLRCSCMDMRYQKQPPFCKLSQLWEDSYLGRSFRWDLKNRNHFAQHVRAPSTKLHLLMMKLGLALRKKKQIRHHSSFRLAVKLLSRSYHRHTWHPWIGLFYWSIETRRHYLDNSHITFEFDSSNWPRYYWDHLLLKVLSRKPIQVLGLGNDGHTKQWNEKTYHQAVMYECSKCVGNPRSPRINHRTYQSHPNGRYWPDRESIYAYYQHVLKHSLVDYRSNKSFQLDYQHICLDPFWYPSN